MGKFGETRGGVGKSGVIQVLMNKDVYTYKAPKRVKTEEKLLWMAYSIGTEQRFFHSRPPAPPSPRL